MIKVIKVVKVALRGCQFTIKPWFYTIIVIDLGNKDHGRWVRYRLGRGKILNGRALEPLEPPLEPLRAPPTRPGVMVAMDEFCSQTTTAHVPCRVGQRHGG